MSEETIQFELVSPERKLVSEPMAHAVLPGTEGEMGVGPRHASYVVTLGPGVVKLFAKKGDTEPRKIFIAGGFADITGELCTVLAEQATNVEELDQGALEQQMKDLKEDLGLAEEYSDKERILKQIEMVRLRIQAVTGKVAVA